MLNCSKLQIVLNFGQRIKSAREIRRTDDVRIASTISPAVLSLPEIIKYVLVVHNSAQFSKVDFSLSGFDEYRIVHRCSEGGGNFKYSAVHTRDEIPVEIRISGASPNRDPLKEIQLIKLRVDTDKFITGMEDCGDCVVRKWCDKIYENSFYIYIYCVYVKY